MPLFQNHAGLNITNEKLQIVEVDYKENKFFLENVDEELFSEKITLENSDESFINILQSAFDNITLRRPLNCKSVSFTFPHNIFKIVELPYDSTLLEKDLQEHFRWELKTLFPQSNPDDYLIRYIEIDKSNIRNENSAIIMAADKNIIKLIHNFCLKNGLELKFVDNAHIASNTFISLGNNNTAHELYLSLYISQENVSIIVLDEDYPICFKVSKLRTNNDLSDNVTECLRGLKKYGIGFDSFSRCYLSGDNIPDELIHHIKQDLNIQLTRYNPFDKLKADSSLYENPNFIEKFNSFSAAAGIALRMI